jgi:hypothetical protein
MTVIGMFIKFILCRILKCGLCRGRGGKEDARYYKEKKKEKDPEEKGMIKNTGAPTRKSVPSLFLSEQEKNVIVANY